MSTVHNTRSESRLNVHAILRVSCANGPGARAVVWTQGCRLRCPGCCNPLTHSHRPRTLMEPKRLADHILSIPDIEGLSVSGGEPFEQAPAVARLCRAVRGGGLSVLVFTGRTYEFIRRSPSTAVKELLSQVDILVDGPFSQRLADSRLLWRGSSNQCIRFLTSRYGPEVLETCSQPQVEAQFAAGQAMGITGFPEPSDLDVLARRLREDEGILLERSSCRSQT